MHQDDTPMTYDPADGGLAPTPEIASHWRVFNDGVTWTYNPWTGNLRDDRDIESDATGLLIIQ
jgi:hypothetical protein